MSFLKKNNEQDVEQSMEKDVTFHSPIKGQPTINVQEKIPRSLGVPQELIQMEWQLKEIGKIVIMDVQELLK